MHELLEQHEKNSLLSVQNLQVEFHTRDAVIHAVNGVSFELAPGETLGVVGESACGKSVTALSVMGLLPKPIGRIVGGSIHFRGQDLLALRKSEMRKIRGRDIGMVFQSPMSALNPLLPIGLQISEVLEEHRGITRSEGLKRAVELLHLVGIPCPEERIHDRPYQMSGGMCQRVMLAAAVACEPSLLIADEPTTALDVTIQAQILELLAQLQRELNMSMILISHDLGVVARICDRAIVMYAGRVVEEAPIEALFADPQHPYTLGLLRSIPKPGQTIEELSIIEGSPPDQRHLPPGCAFAPRCAYKIARCEEEIPDTRFVSPGHLKRCWVDIEENSR
jgi:oligopeptide/dipeptide ABC transporter ATP-binding protein